MEWKKISGNPEELRKKVVPGKAQLLIVGEKRICIAQVDGKFYGVDNKCTHNGESLGKGTINYLGEVVCPWHGYRFDMKTGRCQNDAADLETYPVREDENGVYIGL